MSITPAMKHFMGAAKFVVIGRVMTDPGRHDHKVFKWYLDRGLPVTPVKPGMTADETVESLPMVSDVTQLDLTNTSISIIISPAIGIKVLQSLFPPNDSGGVEPRGVWFQPGAENEAIQTYVVERGLQDRVVFGGPCVLVSGDAVMKAIGSKEGKL